MANPTKAELDSRLSSAARTMRAMPAKDAGAFCANEKAWAYSNWPGPVAKGFTDLLREAYRKRFRR